MLRRFRLVSRRRWTSPSGVSFLAKAAILSIAISIIPAVSHAADTSNFSKSGCKDYILVGLRGSGEPYSPGTPNGELGQRISILYGKLAQDPKFGRSLTYASVPSRQFQAKGLLAYDAMNYELSDRYFMQVVNGNYGVLLDLVVSLGRQCQNSMFILAGYSQGAYAVHQVLQTFDAQWNSGIPSNRQLARRIIGAALLADPGQPNSGLLPVTKQIASSKSGFLLNSTVTAFYVYGLPGHAKADAFTTLMADSKAWTYAGPINNIKVYAFFDPGDVVADAAGWLMPSFNIFKESCNVLNPLGCPLSAHYFQNNVMSAAHQAELVHTRCITNSGPTTPRNYCDDRFATGALAFLKSKMQ